MKTVIDCPDNVTLIKNTNAEERYYGVEWNMEVFKCPSIKKGFIAQERCHAGNFYVRCVIGFTYSNGWTDWTSSTLQGCIRNLITKGHAVYEFESFKELSEWLTK